MNKGIVLLFLLTATSLFARFDEPFSKIELGIGVGSEITENRFHDYWKQGRSINTHASIPYYYGSFELGVTFSEYLAISNKTIDFDAVAVSIGWGKGWHLLDNLKWHNSAAFTNNIMNLKYETENVSESEISFTLYSQLKYTFYRNNSLFAGFEYSNMFTFQNINHLNFFIGISHSIKTPEIFTRFLK